jgi:phage tail-like protein
MIDLERPLAAYRFLVTLAPGDAHLPFSQAILLPLVAFAGFQQVSGLQGELEILSYAEGGKNDFVHQLPVRHSWSRITLSRGVARDPGLWYWYANGMRQSLGARRSGVIIQMTPLGIPAIAYAFKGGLATKWVGPVLHAQDSKVAVEQLEIAHQGIERIVLSPPEPDLLAAAIDRIPR